MKIEIKIILVFLLVWGATLSVLLFMTSSIDKINWNAVSALASLSSTVAILLGFSQLYESRERNYQEDRRRQVEHTIKYCLDFNAEGDTSLKIQNYSTSILSLRSIIDLEDLNSFKEYPALGFFFYKISELIDSFSYKDLYRKNTRYGNFPNPISYPGDNCKLEKYVLNIDFFNFDVSGSPRSFDFHELCDAVKLKNKIKIYSCQLFSSTSPSVIKPLLSCTVYENRAYAHYRGLGHAEKILLSEGYEVANNFISLCDKYHEIKELIKS